MRILIVEDERKAADYLQKSLRESGYIVEVASNGFDGRYMIEEFDFDLVILDVKMPRMDGMEVLRRLRQTSEIPVIMLTSKDDEIDEILGFNLGADD